METRSRPALPHRALSGPKISRVRQAISARSPFGNARRLLLNQRRNENNAMRKFALLILACLGPNVSFAAAIPKEIPLWPNGAPGSEGKTNQEVVALSKSGEISVWSIHNPSLTPYLPAKEKATGTAMLVIPGG